MARTNIYRYGDEEGRQLVGWFDPMKTEAFAEGTRWDGNNQVTVVAGGTFEHEALHRTKAGRWVLNHWSQWEGREETYEYVTDDQARDWLLICGHDDAVERFWGELAEESGPGRPAIGDPFHFSMPEDLKARVNAARQSGESLAATVRRLLEKALKDTETVVHL